MKAFNNHHAITDDIFYIILVVYNFSSFWLKVSFETTTTKNAVQYNMEFVACSKFAICMQYFFFSL